MNIVVLGGGDSTERAVSLRSARAVSDALKTAGFEVIQLDPIDPGVLDTIEAGSIIFPILHGTNGEDGAIQSELEKRGLPFLGTASQASKNCFNKWETRTMLSEADILFAKADMITIDHYSEHPLSTHPHVLKVHEGGSSIGTLIVREPNKVQAQEVEDVFFLDSLALIEELVEGIEITVPVLDGKALPVIEIRPPEGDEFDYENKYNGETQEICPPEKITDEQQAQARTIAEKAHSVMGCRHLSRSDFMVRPNGEIVMLEINTMPGMTDQSLFPKSARTAGMEFPELMKLFVEMVKRDYGIQ